MSLLDPEYHAHSDDPQHLKNKAKKSPAEAGLLSFCRNILHHASHIGHAASWHRRRIVLGQFAYHRLGGDHQTSY